MKNKLKITFLVSLVALVIGVTGNNISRIYAVSDINTSDENYDAITYVLENKISNGFSDGTFRAEKTITRAELTKILINAKFSEEEIKDCNTEYFEDVPSTHTFFHYICMAKEHNLIGGYSDGKFYPDKEISAFEAIKIIAVAYGRASNSDWMNAGEDKFKPYSDSLSETNAIPDSIQYGFGMLNRGQMAEFIFRLDKKIKTKPSVQYSTLARSIPADSGQSGEGNGVAGNYETDEWGSYVEVTKDGIYRYIKTNSMPNHQTGEFPNSHNPNTISEHYKEYKVLLNPTSATSTTKLGMYPFGVAVNGIVFDPIAAEYWNNDPTSGWNYDPLGGGINLGVDDSNAHVQPDGTYHYHSVPYGMISNLNETIHSPLVGYAADGFPIYAKYGYSDPDTSGSLIKKMLPGYKVKSGTRNGGPGGTYNGSFVEDYSFVAGYGDLDECNGRTTKTPEYPNGTYAYFLTDEFPNIPRCFKGVPDSSFFRNPGGQATGQGQIPAAVQGGQLGMSPVPTPPRDVPQQGQGPKRPVN